MPFSYEKIISLKFQAVSDKEKLDFFPVPISLYLIIYSDEFLPVKLCFLPRKKALYGA